MIIGRILLGDNMAGKKTYIIGNSSRAASLEQLCRAESDKLEVIKENFEPERVETIRSAYDTKIVFLLDGISNYLANLGTIRKQRKDIFAVGFDTTHNLPKAQQYLQGLQLLKEASANLILSHDQETGINMIVAPEETTYHVTADEQEVLHNLAEIAYLRSHLTFTRSTVVAGNPVNWNSTLVPQSLMEVVDYCRTEGAYKVFNGATTGHFAVKLDDHTFLTSRRKTDFNQLDQIGLVKVTTDGPDSVIAYGSKPSVGGQSQRIVFQQHPEYDSIVHFHCPKKKGSAVPRVSQREYECGSHECGKNTSRGLYKFGNLSAVYLDNHGPNIVFHSSIDPQEVITFINENFDLAKKTGGYV